MAATVSLHDLLEELAARDEALEKLVVAYFTLEAKHQELSAEAEVLRVELAIAKAYQQAEKKSVHGAAIGV